MKRVKREESFYYSHSKLWKYFFKWKKLADSNSIEAKLPWINFQVIDFLEKHINPSSKIFEYGGGGSTLFFLERAAEVITVEHNKEWFKILESNAGNDKKWIPIFSQPEVVDNFNIEEVAVPDKYFSTAKEFENKSFYKYASSIDKYNDNYFDVVLVDGRARPSCMKHAIPKIKKGGYLILDNSDRPYYTEYLSGILKSDFDEIINYSGPTPFCTWFNRTNVWKKK